MPQRTLSGFAWSCTASNVVTRSKDAGSAHSSKLLKSTATNSQLYGRSWSHRLWQTRLLQPRGPSPRTCSVPYRTRLVRIQWTRAFFRIKCPLEIERRAAVADGPVENSVHPVDTSWHCRCCRRLPVLWPSSRVRQQVESCRCRRLCRCRSFDDK